MADKPQLTPAVFLCTGYGLSTQKKELVGIKEVPEGMDTCNLEGKEIWLSRKDFRLNPGNVYSISTNAERTSFSKATRWLRQWGNVAEAIDMQMRAKAWDTNRAVERIAKKEGTATKIIEDALRPVKHAYQQMSFAERTAFEVWLIRYLHRMD